MYRTEMLSYTKIMIFYLNIFYFEKCKLRPLFVNVGRPMSTLTTLCPP